MAPPSRGRKRAVVLVILVVQLVHTHTPPPQLKPSPLARQEGGGGLSWSGQRPSKVNGEENPQNCPKINDSKLKLAWPKLSLSEMQYYGLVSDPGKFKMTITLRIAQSSKI